MNYRLIPLIFLSLSATTLLADPVPWPSPATTWHGYEKREISVAGHAGYVVLPQKPAPGSPWYWTAEFHGATIADDMMLLDHGWTLAYVDMTNMYGSPKAIAVMEGFYDELTGKYGLSTKPVLKGISRGGFYIFNFAAAHPDRVAALYGDAPVCDFKSWPGGKGKSKGSPADWKRLMDIYGFKDEAQALAYTHNPIDNLAVIANAHIPILIVAGDSDKTVPYEENGGIVKERYEKLGGKITVILKPGGDHHPHGLKDPKPIVDFMLKYADYPGKATE
jgi:pimeloyl-ACP methyl ester carboxylesterase